jgi:tRNA(Arg) A34 adenosine deaminase TadA
MKNKVSVSVILHRHIEDRGQQRYSSHMHSPLTKYTRRLAMQAVAVLTVPAVARQVHAAACGDDSHFAAEAERMRQLAVSVGDQAYGAVVVLDGCIVGYGPSRVVQDNNVNAHAERVALWDAQKRLGRSSLSGALIYSTSPPCMTCQQALARAQVRRMFAGPTAEDAGPPQANR